MNALLVLLVFVLLLGGVGLLVYLTVRHRQKRIAELQAFAAARGWLYVPEDPALGDRFAGTPFGKGFNRRGRDTFRGGYRGREFVGFEYTYQEQHYNGKTTQTITYRYTVVALAMPALRPTLQLGLEGFGRKLLGLVGVRDLQLESEEFNKAFLISTDNDRFAYDILHPRMMQWMLADPRCRRWPFRYERADLLTWERGRLSPALLQAMLDYLCDVADRAPEFVWHP